MFSREELEKQAALLRESRPEAAIEWALAHFPGRVALTCSFSSTGVVLAHMLSRIDRSIPVIFLDTGLLFPETYLLKNQFVERYNINVVEHKPEKDPGALYTTDPDGCCYIRKVEPMQRALAGLDAWITGLRRDQSDSRRTSDILEYHEVNGRPLAKVLPLAYWTRKETWAYIMEQGVPYHPLLDQGYSSIGCWPCTRAVAPGEHERAGRWAGTGKTECGLHTFTTRG